MKLEPLQQIPPVGTKLLCIAEITHPRTVYVVIHPLTSLNIKHLDSNYEYYNMSLSRFSLCVTELGNSLL